MNSAPDTNAGVILVANNFQSVIFDFIYGPSIRTEVKESVILKCFSF